MKTALAIAALLPLFLASCQGGRASSLPNYAATPAIPSCMLAMPRISTYEYSKLTGSFNNPTIPRQ